MPSTPRFNTFHRLRYPQNLCKHLQQVHHTHWLPSGQYYEMLIAEFFAESRHARC